MTACATLRRGATWNESRTFADPITGRTVRQITTTGARNQTPTYHTRTCFTAASDRLILVTQRDGAAALCAADVATGQITVLTDPVPAATGFNAMAVALADEARQAVCQIAGAVHLVDIDGGDQRLVQDAEDRVGSRSTIPAISADGRRVAFTRVQAVPDDVEPGLDGYRWLTEHGGGWYDLVIIDTSSGDARVLKRETGLQCAHAQFCPGDPGLLLLDRDHPPLYAWGSDGKRTRAHLFRREWDGPRALDSRIGTPFQVHSTFTHDGAQVIYHGWLGRDNHSGWYYSVFSTEGSLLREFAFPEAAHYGHVSAAADRPAMILDGNLTSDCFQFLFYDRDMPRLELIGRHGTEWDSLPRQEAHPHPQHSNDGRWLVYTAARAGRNDVFVMEL